MFTGAPATGKSSYYRERLSDSHVRINLDMLRTRRREELLLESCLASAQSFVVDNTKPKRSDRARYLQRARAAGFGVRLFYFQSRIDDCLRRNADREAPQRIREAGVLGVYNSLEMPAAEEGFDEIRFVQLTEQGFATSGWRDEV